MITKRELAELLTPFGFNFIPAKLWSKLFSANKAKDPPLCSKKAQKTIEKNIKAKAANNFFLSSLVHFDIS